MSDNMIIDYECGYGGKNNDDSNLNSAYTVPQVQFPRITQAEARLKNDLIEFENKRMTTKHFKVILSNIIIGQDQQSFLILCEFEGLFKIVIKIKEDYPFSFPDIIYHSGSYTYIFDHNGVIKLEFLSKEKWSPVLSLNSILFSIELLLLGQNNLDVSTFIKENTSSPCKLSTYLSKNEDPITEKYKNRKRKKKYSEYFEERKEYITPKSSYYNEIEDQACAFMDIETKMRKINLCLSN